MEHDEAVRLQAAEKYVLGELSPTQREEYEEHYFDCAECAFEMKAAAAFVDTSREVFKADKKEVADRAAAPARGGWFSWLRPMAVPACAALLLVVIYQNIITIPRLKNATPGAAVAEIYGQTFLIQPSDTRRGSETPVNETTLEVRPNEGFLLQFDFTPSSTFPAYVCQLQDASGRVLQQVTVPGDRAKQELHLLVPAGLLPGPGKYSVVLLGADPVSGKAVNDGKLQYFTFSVAFRR